MLEFKPVTKQEAPRLRRYYQTCEFGLCEYSVGTKLMWKAALHPPKEAETISGRKRGVFMNAKKFSDALSALDGRYVEEAARGIFVQLRGGIHI